MVNYLCSLVWPFVESYWVSVVYLFSLKNHEGTRLHKLVQQVYFLIIIRKNIYNKLDSMVCRINAWRKNSGILWDMLPRYHKKSFTNFQSLLNKTIFYFFLILFSKAQGILKKNLHTKLTKVNISEDQLHDLENHINKFMKNSYAKSVDSPIDIARKSMLVDFPFMAKLSKL